jgi:hypothetical protein
MNKMKNMYIIKYSGGSYDDFYTTDIFVTTNKSKATRYATKFNRILKTWKDHYKKYEEKKHGFGWIKDEFVEKKYDRWSSLNNVNRCFVDKIQQR